MINLRANIKDDANLVEYIREFLCHQPEGATSLEIVREIFLLPDRNARVAQLLVENLLSQEEAFFCDPQGYWRLRPSSQLQKPFNELSFVVVDLETTGGGTRHHRIIEIGAVKIVNRRITETFKSFIDPQRGIPDYVIKITGIKPSMLVNAPLASEILPKFLDFLGDSVVIAHNLPYDLGFLNTTLSRYGSRRVHNHALCTLELSRLLVPELRNHKLEDLADFFEVSAKTRHRALDDARATARVFIYLLERLEEGGFHTLEHVYDLLPKKERLDVSELILDKHDVHAMPEAKGVFMFADTHQEIVYLEGTYNIRQRVRDILYGRTTQTLYIQQIIRNTAELKAIPTATYAQAKIKAVELIDQYHPRFNLLHAPRLPLLKVRRDKTGLTVELDRNYVPQENVTYFGPFFNEPPLEELTAFLHEHAADLEPEELDSMETLWKLRGNAEKYAQLAAYFEDTILTIYVGRDFDLDVLELDFIQNYRLVGLERLRFVDEVVDLLRDEALLTLKPYHKPIVGGLPRIFSPLDLLRAEELRELEQNQQAQKYQISVKLKQSKPAAVVQEIIRIGYRLIRHWKRYPA